MTEGVQFLLLVIGALLSVLVTLLLAQISGIRSDLKTALKKQEDEAMERINLDLRLTVLETEHRSGACRFLREVS